MIISLNNLDPSGEEEIEDDDEDDGDDGEDWFVVIMADVGTDENDEDKVIVCDGVVDIDDDNVVGVDEVEGIEEEEEVVVVVVAAAEFTEVKEESTWTDLGK